MTSSPLSFIPRTLGTCFLLSSSSDSLSAPVFFFFFFVALFVTGPMRQPHQGHRNSTKPYSTPHFPLIRSRFWKTAFLFEFGVVSPPTQIPIVNGSSPS